MAKFIKTPDLWDIKTVRKIKSGELVLQPGQWVRCGDKKLSRFVRFNPASKTFNVAHGKDCKDVNLTFSKRIEVERLKALTLARIDKIYS